MRSYKADKVRVTNSEVDIAAYTLSLPWQRDKDLYLKPKKGHEGEVGQDGRVLTVDSYKGSLLLPYKKPVTVEQNNSLVRVHYPGGFLTTSPVEGTFTQEVLFNRDYGTMLGVAFDLAMIAGIGISLYSLSHGLDLDISRNTLAVASAGLYAGCNNLESRPLITSAVAAFALIFGPEVYHNLQLTFQPEVVSDVAQQLSSSGLSEQLSTILSDSETCNQFSSYLSNPETVQQAVNMLPNPEAAQGLVEGASDPKFLDELLNQLNDPSQTREAMHMINGADLGLEDVAKMFLAGLTMIPGQVVRHFVERTRR